jgi:rod shape-determining protein MreD
MQTSYSSSRILLAGAPVVHRLQPARSRCCSISCRPRPGRGCPTGCALVIVFWSVREPRRVGMGLAFLLGVAMDVADASLLGQHALAYVLAGLRRVGAVAPDPVVPARAAGACRFCRCSCWSQLVQFSVRVMLTGADSAGDQLFPRAAGLATLLWPLLTFCPAAAAAPAGGP